MTRRRVTRGKARGKPAPLDLGITLSVYGKSPEGRLVELRDAGAPVSDGRDPWPTEQ